MSEKLKIGFDAKRVFQNKDGILKLSEDTELSSKMIGPGLKNAERFLPEFQAKQIMNIYQNL